LRIYEYYQKFPNFELTLSKKYKNAPSDLRGADQKVQLHYREFHLEKQVARCNHLFKTPMPNVVPRTFGIGILRSVLILNELSVKFNRREYYFFI